VDATQACSTATFEASSGTINLCLELAVFLQAAEAAEAEVEAIMREEVQPSLCGQRMSFKQLTLLGSLDSL